MAFNTYAPWEELYGVCLRKDVSLVETSSADGNAPSVMSDGTLSTQGQKLFDASNVHTDTTTGELIGIPGTDWKDASEKYGVPVTNQPIFEIGQEINEYNKAIGDSAPTAGVGYSFQRGTQQPTTTFEFDVDRYTALPFLVGMFQNGTTITKSSDSLTTDTLESREYLFTFPDAADGSTPTYYLSLFKTINFPSGELISDAIPTSMTLTCGENEPLKASVSFLGARFINTTFNSSTFSSAAGINNGGAVAVEFAELNPYHWNDATVVIDMGGDNHYVVEASALSLTITNNVVTRRYNDRYAHKFVSNGYTVEGSLTIPYYYDSSMNSETLKDILTSSTVSVTPTPIDIFWFSSSLGEIGSTITESAMSSYRDMNTNDGATWTREIGDLRIRINAVFQSIPDTPEDEVMLTLNFVGANIRSGNSVTSHAFELAWHEEGDSFSYLGARPTA